MRSSKLVLFIISAALAAGCQPTGGDQGNQGGPALPNGPTLPSLSGNNVMTLTVNGSQCSSNSYLNKPCVSVTVCTPDQSSCQTIDDILLDTGSYGLRVFKSVFGSTVLSSLTPVTSGGQPVAECVRFGDGSADWGQVEMATLVLGHEPAARVPIQVVDSGFSNSSAYCSGADASPSAAGFNGILGVGLFPQDCGLGCAHQANNGIYFTCSGTTCAGTTVGIADQVTNPVALLPHDNNGVIVELPSVPPEGVPSSDGYLVLGIGTEPNNSPSNVTTQFADAQVGEFQTKFNGQTVNGFIDSGSNGLFFVAPSASQLPDCGKMDSNFGGWFCPSSAQSFMATNIGQAGSASLNVPFQIENLVDLESASNNVFDDVGGQAGGIFDWGLPFYLGRNVYVGIEGKTSSLGIGPYWAY